MVDLEGEPNFQELLDEYAIEAGCAGMPKPNADIETYKKMELMGFLKCIGAFDGGKLIGFLTLVTTNMPHYKAQMSTSESYFVTKEHRGSGAGDQLRRAGERLAEGLGSIGILMSARIGSGLEVVLGLSGYGAVNKTYFKRLGNV